MNFDDITEKISDASAKAISKGKAAKEVVSLKAELNTCEDMIKRSYLNIGRKFYEQNAGKEVEPEYAKSMKEIENAKKAIEELNNKIAEIKAKA